MVEKGNRTAKVSKKGVSGDETKADIAFQYAQLDVYVVFDVVDDVDVEGQCLRSAVDEVRLRIRRETAGK